MCECLPHQKIKNRKVRLQSLQRRDVQVLRRVSTRILTLYVFYLLTLYKMSGAAVFNLSLLTSDMWAVLIRIFFYHQQVDWLYYLSFAVVVLGLLLYSLSDTSTAPAIATIDEVNIPYQPLHEESAEARVEP